MLAEETQVFFVRRSIPPEEGSLESEEFLVLFVWSLGEGSPRIFLWSFPKFPNLIRPGGI
jgi:hypothetical protein